MKHYPLFKFEEPDDNGGGSHALDLLGPVDVSEVDAGAAADVDNPDDASDAPPKVKEFDPNAFAKEFGESFARSLPSTKKEEEPKLTIEEAKKLMRVWEPDEEFLAQFDNLENRKTMLLKLRDGFVGQADAIAQYRLREALEAQQQQFAPVLTYVQQQMIAQTENEFYSQYPVLKNDKLTPLIASVANDMKARGAVTGDKKKDFQQLAAGVEAVIKLSNPDFTLKAPASSTPSSQRNSAGRIPVQSGGSGGGGGSKPVPQTGPRAIQILGKVGK